jgi:DNA polymerase delta, subunit 4
MGLTRLERWHRAKDLGECPPEEICEILNTREGVLDLRLSILDY